MEHTPGPWRVELFQHSPHARIQPAVGVAKGGSIADVYNSDANARLIAAAPELLDALNRFVAMSEQGRWVGDLDDEPLEVVAAGREAIAKAQGA